MKEKYLRLIYNKYRSFFYSLFIEEFLGQIPKEVQEPATTFFGAHKLKLEKWILFHAHLLQRRIQTEPNEVATYQGMLLYLKLLLAHVMQAPSPTIKTQGKPEEKKPDHIGNAESAIAELKKVPKKTD